MTIDKYVTQTTFCYLLNIILFHSFAYLTQYISVFNTPLNLPVKPVGENSRTIALSCSNSR